MEWTVADFTNILMPSDCRVCGAAMAALAPVRVCEACVERVETQAAAEQDVLCTRCGDALGMESARFAAAMGVSECTMCRLAPPQFDRAVAHGTYEDEMRRMLHLLKFEGMRGVAEYVLDDAMAAAALRLRGVAADELVVIPVPLFGAREKARGFNQAKVLAEVMMKRLRKIEPLWTLRLEGQALVRVKDTQGAECAESVAAAIEFEGCVSRGRCGGCARTRGVADRRHYDYRSYGAGVCAGAEARRRSEGLGGDGGAGAAGECVEHGAA